MYEAQELLKFCPNVIRKVRYIVYHMGNKWEIDEFLGENEGLVITDCLPPNASKNKDIVFLSQGGYMQGIIHF